MATYTEIHTLFHNSELRNRVQTALIISVNNLTDTASNNAFAALAYSNPLGQAQKVLMSVLATNNALDLATIQAATDSAIQTNVDAAVDTLVKALAGV